MNTTNKYITLKKGCSIARLERVDGHDIMQVNSASAAWNIKGDNQSNTVDFSELDVPSQHRDKLVKILTNNSDLFAQKDSE